MVKEQEKFGFVVAFVQQHVRPKYGIQKALQKNVEGLEENRKP